MLKSVKIKFLISFILIGLILILGMGFSFIYNLQMINVNSEEVANLVNLQISQVKFIMATFSVAFTVIISILGYFIVKMIISPVTNLVKSAEQATKQERIKYLGDGKKKQDINDLVVAFDTMNNELKENLNEATRQKKQMETILLHMTDGIIAFDIAGKVIHINPAAKKFLKLEDEKTFEDIFDKYDLDINVEKLIYLDNWTSQEKKLILEDISINLFFAPFKNENDRPAGLIVVIQDITEHVKLDTMRKTFVADISHELKTPITSIMGYADTLLESEVDEEITTKFLGRISSEAARMARLVSDLLTLSRYDTSKVKIEKTEFDLGELVKNIYDGLDFEIQKKNQKAECFVTANVPLVFADKNGIERVVVNILTNAIKYTPESGTIKVYVGFVYNDAYIKIIDTGIGIPKEDLDKIYERFYRVDKARTREMGGTGLGLSIAKEILDQNEGMIDIKSEQGKGTEVVIRIPTKQGKLNKELTTEQIEEEIKSEEEVEENNVKNTEE